MRSLVCRNPSPISGSIACIPVSTKPWLRWAPVRRGAAGLDLADDAVMLYFDDGTERPIQRPKDPEVQETFYSGKKKRHTVKNNVLVNAHGEIALLTATCEGKKHDKKIADEAAVTLPEGSLLYQIPAFKAMPSQKRRSSNPRRSPRR